MYMRYIAELLGSEIFLMQKFNTQIIFTVKISQSTVRHITSLGTRPSHTISRDGNDNNHIPVIFSWSETRIVLNHTNVIPSPPLFYFCFAFTIMHGAEEERWKRRRPGSVHHVSRCEVGIEEGEDNMYALNLKVSLLPVKTGSFESY